MTKAGEQKATPVAHGRVPQPKNRSRSHRVELVIARIFAKQRAGPKQRSLRRFDLEDADSSWD